MRLYIIRHAQSTNNALVDPSERVCDPPLTALGLRQAEILARHLATQTDPAAAPGNGRRGYGLTRLYTSPMRRAVQTARVLGCAAGLRPEVWVDIHEQGGIYLDHGPERGFVGYPGMGRSEMLAECPGLLAEGVGDRGWWTGSYEEMPACRERAARVAATLRRWTAREDTVALVTHGNLIDALLKALLDPESDWENSYYHNYNTAISLLAWPANGQPEVRYLGYVGHLPQELLS